MTKKTTYHEALNAISIESSYGHVSDRNGDYPYKKIGGIPINNPYGNLSRTKLKTALNHLVYVFKRYKKPYWANVTLFYPSQLPDRLDIIKDCTTAVMESKFTSHFIIATEAGTKNNRYHHHVFVYAGSFESLCKATKKLKKTWGEILFSRFENIFEECAVCDAFDTAHIYEDSTGQQQNIEKTFRNCIINNVCRELLPYKSLELELDDRYDDGIASKENYSKLARVVYPNFDKLTDDQWRHKATYHLSYICKKNNKDMPPLPLRRSPRKLQQ